MTEKAFNVVYRPTPPAPSWTAYKSRSRGILTILATHALFQPKSGSPIEITQVRKVTKGWKGSVHGTPMMPIVDTWTEVVYGPQGAQSVAFFNDPRLLWLASYLPHRSLVRSLEDLISES